MANGFVAVKIGKVDRLIGRPKGFAPAGVPHDRGLGLLVALKCREDGVNRG